MRTQRPALFAQLLRLRVVCVGAIALLAIIGAALALPSAGHVPPGAAAAADPDAIGGVAQAPDDGLREKALGGAKTVSRATLERAAEQAKAIPSAGGSWEYVGANNIGGRVTDVVVDPTQANTIYVASAGGGVWKSTDAGMTYTPSWPADYPQAIGALARGSDGTLWAGTGEANASGGGITYVGDGVYRSTDGGVTWKNVGIDQAGMIGRIAVDPTNPQRVLVAAAGSLYSTGGNRGLYRTLDGGKHWKAILKPDLDAAPFTGVVDVAIDPVNPNRVYATQWDHHRTSYLRPYGGIGSGLYVTDNAMTKQRQGRDVGADRQLARLRPAAELRQHELQPAEARATGLDVSDTLGRMGVAIAPSDHTRVYLITGETFGSDKGFFVSDNGDRPLADGGPTFVAGGHAGGNPRFEWWFGRLFVDPVNKNHLFKTDVSLRRSSRRRHDVGERGRAARRPARDGVGPERAEPRVPRQRRRHVPLRRERRQRLDPRHEHAVAPGVPRRRLAAAAEPNRDRPAGQRLEPQLVERQRRRRRSRRRQLGLVRRRRRPLRRDRRLRRHVLLLVQPERRLQRRARRGLDDDDAVRGGRRGRHEREAGERQRPRRGQHDHDRLDRSESGDGHDDHRGHCGRNRHGRDVRAGPRVRACVRGNGGEERRHRHAEPRLRLAWPRACAARRTHRSSRIRRRPRRCTSAATGCSARPTAGSTWTTIAAPDALTGPAPADDGPNNNPLYAGQFPTISTIAPSKSDPNTIYVGTDNGRLWKTTDLGGTWQEFPNPFAPDPARWVTSVIVDPLDSNHAFASYGGFREGYTSANVYETTDGATWKNVSGNLPNAPVNFLAYDRANDTLYAATDFGVFFTQRATEHWKKLGANLPNTATEDLKIQASSGKLYVATFGRGTWRIPLVAGKH